MQKNTKDIEGSSWHPFNSEKVLCHADRIEAIVNEQYLPPVVMNLDVTSRCQYRCVHCHHRRKQVGDADLPDLSERLARTLPYFLKHWTVNGYGVRAVCIVGSRGDALLYPHLPKLLKDLHYTGMDVGLVTNGFGFNDELINYAAFYCKFVGFSMDAGSAETYSEIKGCVKMAYDEVRSNIQQLTRAIMINHLRNDVGWKILILPDNQHEIYESCKIAKELGCRYVQIRPADLPEEERAEVEVNYVLEQIQRAIADMEEPDVFEIVGVRHKFTNDFKKVLPKYCYLTPLTVTVTCDGKAYACVDRRCDELSLLADCGMYGWSALKDVWGSATHVDIVHNEINQCGHGPGCRIRCSNYGYNKYFQNYFLKDKMDRNLV